MMQRIFKYGDIQNINLTPDKKLNILIYWTLSRSSCTGVINFKNGPVFVSPYVLGELDVDAVCTDASTRRVSRHVWWRPLSWLSSAGNKPIQI